MQVTRAKGLIDRYRPLRMVRSADWTCVRANDHLLQFVSQSKNFVESSFFHRPSHSAVSNHLGLSNRQIWQSFSYPAASSRNSQHLSNAIGYRKV
jgi:hypothetical protein